MTAWLLRLLGALILLSAVVLAMSRAPERPVDTLVARWAPPPSDFIELRGQLVHLRDEGPRDDPLPVVLIHGTSASLHTWEGWVRALKGQRRVISFDLPGFGLTGPATGAYAAAGYHGDTYARFVLDLLDHLQVRQAVIGGNSLGGEVAWRTAVMAPARVHSLVLVDAAGPAFTPDAVPLGWIVARTPVLGRVTEWILPRSLVAQGLASVYGDPTKVTPELVDRYFELTLREGNRRALRERLQAMTIGEHAERIATIRQPTLLVWGGRDRIFDLGVARAFEQAIPGSRLVVFDALGHVPQEEDPAASVAPVREFLGLR
ncbi:MAG: alpha/beta hydrolase [Rubrivivax sp.]|nr:alpha/beta hydrolase [Rubrivivax sp.]